MSLSLEQVWGYLHRIRFPLNDRLPRPELATLVQLHDLHTRYVVFENMSIVVRGHDRGLQDVGQYRLGLAMFDDMQVPQWKSLDMTAEGLRLDVPSLYNKIVKRGRGGYCFEINTLFAALLIGMGYSVRQGMGRVVMDGLEVNAQVSQDHLYLMTPHVHQILFVSGGMLPQDHVYLCDGGLGGNTLTAPILIPTREIITAAPTCWDAPPAVHTPQYRLRWGKCGTPAPAVPQDIDTGYYLQIWANRVPSGGAWHDLYYFNLSTYGPMDFAAANYFTSTFPQSLFVKGPFCSRVNEVGGRFILIGNQLKYRDITGASETQMLNSQDDLATALRSHFGIELNSASSVIGMPAVPEDRVPRFH